MLKLLLNLLLLHLVCLAGCGEYEPDGQLTITVFHSLEYTEDAVFTPRGTISLRSLRGVGSATYLPAGALTQNEINQLKALVESDGLYRLKMLTHSAEGRKTEVATFIKACRLAESGLRETIQLHLDPAGNLLAASLHARVGRCHGNGTTYLTGQPAFKTEITIKQTEIGPAPDTAAFIQKMEQEKLAKQRGETKDNRSFIAKYWMYIVPVVLLLMVSGGPEQQGGGGGGR